MFLNFFAYGKLGTMADSRYTGFREITDRDILDLYCIYCIKISYYYSQIHISCCQILAVIAEKQCD